MASLESDELEIKTLDNKTNEANKEGDSSGKNADVGSETERVFMTLFVETSSQVLIAMKGNRRIVVVNIP